MSSDGSQRGRGWQWILGVALVGLFGVLAYLMMPDGDSGWGEPGDTLGEPPDDGEAGASVTGGGGPELRAPEGQEPAYRVPRRPTEPAPEPFDPAELAAALYDGGRPPPEAGLPLAAAEPAAESEAPAPPREPVRVGPTPPETALSRAVFWRDLLSSRIEALRREAEEARESGDEARLRRATRMIDRLEAQRPAVSQRVTELEAALPPE